MEKETNSFLPGKSQKWELHRLIMNFSGMFSPPLTTCIWTGGMFLCSEIKTAVSICRCHVHIYLEDHSACSLVRIGTPKPLYHKRVCPTPAEPGGGDTRLRVRGRGESQFRRLEKKLNTLSHRLNMEVDLQSLFGLHVTWCAQLHSMAETPPPHTPALGLGYEGAIGQQR